VPDTSCPGSACYEAHGHPVLLRPAFWVYRELAGKEQMVPEPPSHIVIHGPARGRTNEPVSFTATISRSTATRPITYTWQAPGHSQTIYSSTALQNSVAFSWPHTGTYAVSVAGTNAGGTVINTHVIHIYESGSYEARENNVPSVTSTQPEPYTHHWLVADN
jgi:hypothetical protein